MATCHGETFDINMALSEVVRIRHYISRFIRRSLVLKIRPNTGQMIGTTDTMERRINMTKSEGPNYDCNFDFFSHSEKSHNGGKTWHIFLPKSEKD